MVAPLIATAASAALQRFGLVANTTIGVKLDEVLRARIKDVAQNQGRTSHALIKQSILSALDRHERGLPPDIGPSTEKPSISEVYPFLDFARNIQPQNILRARITAAHRQPEPECLPILITGATLPKGMVEAARSTAKKLVEALRSKGQRGGVEDLIQEYSLSSLEGVALMCLAEALLRIPDRAARDALIRDKIAIGDWQSHVGHSPSVFVNAAIWGLVVTGRLTTTASETGLSTALTRLIAKGGEPLIRRGVDMTARMLGEQLVIGQTIAEALANSRKAEGRGFRYCYDVLGEAATTAVDAEHHFRDYQQAIHAIGKAAARRGIDEGPGISMKLSALHPRYSRAQHDRVMGELLPRLHTLAVLARRYDIGLTIDAEEADRLETSLDLLEALCLTPELGGWNGIGFAVQAYQKRAPFVIDFVIDLARRSGHRLMIRLVKGAYWDSEIKRAQVDGLEGFPVYTRKLYTDVSYLACARKLLRAPDAVFPQFASHNAQTLATIHAMAGEHFQAGQYEFQCLHGMGEPLYDEVVGKDKLNRPCRIHAPVGSHETLLASLVRRLIENGASKSFVNRIADPNVRVKELVADPVAQAAEMDQLGAPHPRVVLPGDLFAPARVNSTGLDLSNEQRLASLAAALLAGVRNPRRAAPLLGEATAGPGAVGRPVLNPADRRDVVGTVVEATPADIDRAFVHALDAAPIWASTPPAERAACLRGAADIMEARMTALTGDIVREAGKSLPNAIAEIREAVDFLRYYGAEVAAHFANDTHRPLGPVVCIGPWNSPLAAFTGQVAAALAAGNPVLAKPAEETPLIAARAVEILREAGVPAGAVQLLPGAGDVGAALVGDGRTAGVVFTGSTNVARLIQRQLAGRLSPNGRTIPLVAETGGQNVLVVDASARAEQVVADVLVSAFDSAGQRCSALRVLCLQEDGADHVLTMLKGAMAELSVGNPDRLSVDVGPVISAEARDNIQAHIEAMRTKGRSVDTIPLPEACAAGTFMAPTLIEIDGFDDLDREVFGPVLHVLRYRRNDLDALIDRINAAGYGSTFGLHTRIDETIARVAERVGAGNLYVNRNMIGAVAGVQPFGGTSLSGTGPKAGGPLYLGRLLAERPAAPPVPPRTGSANPALPLHAWLVQTGRKTDANRCADAIAHSLLGTQVDMPGPVGERNVYGFKPRGRVLADVRTETGLFAAAAAALATGNTLEVAAPPAVTTLVATLPTSLAEWVTVRTGAVGDMAAVLFEGDGDELLRLNQSVADLLGAIVPVHGVSREGLADGSERFPLEWLVEEASISTNTAAAGGNASLMSIG